MDFVDLYHLISATSSTSGKVALLERFFGEAPEGDLGWAIHVLRGGKLDRPVTATQLRALCGEVSGLPGWLIEESYSVVGDLAETISKLVAAVRPRRPVSLRAWAKEVQELKSATIGDRLRRVKESWEGMSEDECLVFNKLITGGLRIGVSQGLVVKALAGLVGQAETAVAQRLAALRDPDAFCLADLQGGGGDSVSMAPYPFCLAFPLAGDASSLGTLGAWLVEWKWDGIRGQIVRRAGDCAVWSRGEELITEAFPDLVEIARHLPDGTVLDGEIVAWRDGAPAPFSDLQRRLNRKRVHPALLSSIPAGFLAYDLLESGGEDLRMMPLDGRRRRLAALLGPGALTDDRIQISPQVEADSWEELDTLRRHARKQGAEGLMVKLQESAYVAGRKRGAWWKWKAEPLSVDGVLVYAQRGHGRRAGLYTDYTFAVWSGQQLVPFAKAYSGLSDAEIQEVDRFVREHTKERFGPVRTVQPLLVFEIAFEGIQASSRHKSGVAVRFPRIARWRRDKPSGEADTIDTLRALAQGQ